MFLNVVEIFHLLGKPGQILLNVLTALAGIRRPRSGGGIQYLQMPFDTFVALLDPLRELVRRKVLVAVIHGPELAASNGHGGFAESFELATEGDNPSAHVANAFAVVPTEAGSRVAVG